MPTPKKPRLSANKLGEYLVAAPVRRRRILYDAKFPSDAVVAYYQPALEAIAQFIAGGMTDISIIEGKIDALNSGNADTLWYQRRLTGNVDALETFISLLDEIDLMGATPSLGAHAASPIAYQGVEISVRPEIILQSSGSKPTVGGIKVHFPKTNPLNDHAAGYVAAMTHEFCNQHHADKGAPNPKLCMVIDIASGTFFPGPSSTKTRLKEVAAACAEVASLWPTIQP